MSSIKDLKTVSPEFLSFDEEDFQQQLLPVLRNAKNQESLQAWKTIMLQECKRALAKIFPFTATETEFLTNLIEKGEIHASLLTNESVMKTKIDNLPSLHWRTSTVKLSMQQNMKNLSQIEEELSLGKLIGSESHKHLRGENLRSEREKFTHNYPTEDQELRK